MSPAPPLIVLDLGHVGRTGGNPPARGRNVREDVLVCRYAAIAAAGLLEAGVSVEIAGSGAYPARRRAARDAGCSLYVACHVNAGTAVDYGLVLHSGGDAAGRASRAIAGALKQECPELRRLIAGEAGIGGWSAATLTLISGVGCPGVLYEPGSLDRPEHDALWTASGLARVGAALSGGILAWLGT